MNLQHLILESRQMLLQLLKLKCITNCERFNDGLTIIENKIIEKFKKIHSTCNLVTINSYGYINPVKKWYFEMIYETVNE